MKAAQPADLKRLDHRLLAAAATWLVVVTVYLYPVDPGQWDSGDWLGLGGAISYAIAIYTATHATRQAAAGALWVRYSALGLAAVSIGVMVLARPPDVVFVLAIIFAAVLPEFFSFRRSVIIQLALHCALTLVYIARWETGWEFLIESLLWLTFEGFALLSSQIAAEERRARQALEFSHIQLEATQKMLAATSRQDERLRISRDIHDVMGHHLTGLSLQLEVASHASWDKAREHIAQAQLITKLLLSDVRQVVSDLREMEHTDLAEALRSLTQRAGKLHIDLTMPEPLHCPETRLAEAVFRTVQEIITNTVRHSGASRLWIDLTEDNGALVITAQDNGRLDKLPVEGNGLRGMRERVEALGGSMQLGLAGGLKYQVKLGGNQR